MLKHLREEMLKIKGIKSRQEMEKKLRELGFEIHPGMHFYGIKKVPGGYTFIYGCRI